MNDDLQAAIGMVMWLIAAVLIVYIFSIMPEPQPKPGPTLLWPIWWD